jgi:hypothetical protein
LIEPEPTIEYVWESQWDARLPALGFQQDLEDGAFYLRKFYWSIRVQWQEDSNKRVRRLDAHKSVVLFIVKDEHNRMSIRALPEFAYNYAAFLVDFLTTHTVAEVMACGYDATIEGHVTGWNKLGPTT